MRHTCSVASTILLLMAPVCSGAAAPPMVVFEPARVEEVYRVLLNRDALLLESISGVIKQKGIEDGFVTVSAGSVQECTYHYVTTTAAKATNAYKTAKGPSEILGAGGVIAKGEPHLHITLSSQGKSAFGGHLEKGCRILYLAEVTIVKYSGAPLMRSDNENGISILRAK